MMTKPQDQAFPVPTTEHDGGHFGLTKREHFAALALQGIASRGATDPKYAAISAVMYADALIAALNE